MSKLELLLGMIASGKSTYARKRADAGALVVSFDDLTQMLHGGAYRYEQGLRDCYRQMEERLAWAAIVAGREVVVDRTHLSRESRHRWIDWAMRFDSAQTYDGHGPTTPVIAVAFPIEAPHVHATRRCERDRRGRGYAAWLKVAEHHYAQALAEPLADDEGFAEIRRIP